MDSRDLPDGRLRATAQQRDHAAAILREAVVDGRLDVEELNARLPTALNAFTREDLYRILDDLVPAAELPAVVAEQVPLGDGPGMRWESPLLIRSGWSGHAQEGAWDLPPFVEILGTGWGGVKLDCTRARPLARVIDIVITGNPSVTLAVTSSVASMLMWARTPAVVCSGVGEPPQVWCRILVSWKDANHAEEDRPEGEGALRAASAGALA